MTDDRDRDFDSRHSSHSANVAFRNVIAKRRLNAAKGTRRRANSAFEAKAVLDFTRGELLEEE